MCGLGGLSRWKSEAAHAHPSTGSSAPCSSSVGIPAPCPRRFFRAMLERFDLDHDGSLEPVELAAMMDALGVGMGAAELEVRGLADGREGWVPGRWEGRRAGWAPQSSRCD